jgi:hypothetical protein
MKLNKITKTTKLTRFSRHSHRTVRHKAPLSERAATTLQILGATLAYLLYALLFSHSHRPWWIALLVGPVVFGSIGAIKHGVEVLFQKILKQLNLHQRRLPVGLATSLSAFVGVVLFKIAIVVFG